MTQTGPNLFILGAPKCGTTALVTWLSAHSQIYVSPRKEPHFYSAEYQLTPSWAKYSALFEGAEPVHRWRCDASVWQLYSDSAVPAIMAERPAARFIVMLRNPLEMVPSMHAQQVLNGNERLTRLPDALARDAARRAGRGDGVLRGYPPDHLAYLHSCALGWQVARLFERVPPAQVHLVFLEDLRADPKACIAAVCAFLGLPVEYPETLERVNGASVRRFATLDRAAKAVGDWKSDAGITLRLGLLARLRKWNRKPQPVQPVAHDVIALMRGAFAEDVVLLGRLTGRDLAHWLEPEPRAEVRT